MMLLTAGDVIMRYFFNSPITGSFELTEYAMVLVIAFTIAYSAANGGLVRVTLISERLSKRTQAIIGAITGLPGIALFVFLAWRSITFIGIQYKQGISSPILEIPRFPFAAIVAFGLVCLILVLIVEWLHSITEAMKK